MMRVALAIDALSPQLTGIGRYTWHLSQGLAIHPAVESLRYYRNRRWFDEPSIFLTGGDIPRNPTPRIFRKFLARAELKRRIFHSPNYFLPERAERSVVTVHDLSVFRYPDFHPAARVRAFEQGFVRSIDDAHHIITDTQWVREELATFAKIPRDRITAVPLGVDRAFFCTQSRSDEPVLAKYGLRTGKYLLCVATLEPRKALDRAIAAFDDYADRHRTDLTLAIAGADGWQDGPLRERIDAARRRGRVTLLGFVDDAHLPAVYANARLFLFPSIYEGFGLPPLEAMAAGVPTVVSNSSCLPEVTQGAAMLVEPDDTEAFRKAIERGLEDDSWRLSAIDAGRRVAAGYTWQRCIDETVSVYQKV